MNIAENIAYYLLSKSHPEMGDIISNLKLQKLLYYSQGAYLALYNKPLFKNEIQHWSFGPVVPDVYHLFKKHSGDALPVDESFDHSLLSCEEKEVIDEVWNVYGQFSAWKLSAFTHEEPPWTDTKDGEVISHQRLKDYFKSLLISDDEEKK